MVLRDAPDEDSRRDGRANLFQVRPGHRSHHGDVSLDRCGPLPRVFDDRNARISASALSSCRSSSGFLALTARLAFLFHELGLPSGSDLDNPSP